MQSLDERLTTYARTRYVNERTGLRRSDRGILELAGLIRDSLVNERPWGMISVAKVRDLAHVAIGLHVPDGSLVRQPHIYVNDQRIDGIYFDFTDESTSPIMIASRRQLEPVRLDLEDLERDPLLNVQVYWMIAVWPSWTIGAQLDDVRMQTTLEVNRGGWADVSLTWNHRSISKLPAS